MVAIIAEKLFLRASNAGQRVTVEIERVSDGKKGEALKGEAFGVQRLTSLLLSAATKNKTVLQQRQINFISFKIKFKRCNKG